MRVIIQPNYKQLSEWAANLIVKRINAANPSPEKPFVLGLPTGSTPLATYQALIEHCRNGKVCFANVITFNMDEYVGLPSDHAESYHTFMWKNFFSHIDIKKEQVNILNGMAADLNLECEQYEVRIKQAGGIDLFLGGIGADGHIAFNEPSSSLSSLTRIKTLTEETKIANARFFDGKSELVPSLALTVGVGTVMAAREVMILVSGHNKAHALQKVVEEGVNHMWTVSMLQMHPKGIIVCSEDATSELRVGTFNYFKDIERENLDPSSIL